MKKNLISIVFISIISFITALIAINILKPLQNAPKNSLTIDTFSKNPSSQKNHISNDSVNPANNIKNDDEIFRCILDAQTYLNSNSPKSLDMLNYYLSRLNKMNAIGVVNDETSKLLKVTIARIINEKKKIHKKEWQ